MTLFTSDELRIVVVVMLARCKNHIHVMRDVCHAHLDRLVRSLTWLCDADAIRAAGGLYVEDVIHLLQVYLYYTTGKEHSVILSYINEIYTALQARVACAHALGMTSEQMSTPARAIQLPFYERESVSVLLAMRFGH